MKGQKTKLSEAILCLVRVYTERDTPAKVAKRWKMNKNTLARALAGYEVNAGSVAQIELGLLREQQRG